MPLTKKGRTIMEAMTAHYGEERDERVFYASRNKGTIGGVDPESRIRRTRGRRPFDGMRPQTTTEQPVRTRRKE